MSAMGQSAPTSMMERANSYCSEAIRHNLRDRPFRLAAALASDTCNELGLLSGAEHAEFERLARLAHERLLQKDTSPAGKALATLHYKATR